MLSIPNAWRELTALEFNSMGSSWPSDTFSGSELSSILTSIPRDLSARVTALDFNEADGADNEGVLADSIGTHFSHLTFLSLSRCVQNRGFHGFLFGFLLT